MENSIYNKKSRFSDNLLNFFIQFSTLISIVLLVVIIGYICYRGIPHFSFDYLINTTSILKKTVGILPNIINTLYMIVVTLLIAGPISIGGAIYLNEYATNKKLVHIISFTTEVLAGIPSIIYGLFGLLFFTTALKWGFSLLSGSLTLVIMILPLVIRTTEEALKSVPDSYREASFGLGAGKLRTIFKVVLPSAVPGILAGVILATGRIVGETAALLYTAGSVAKIPNLMGSGRTLAVHMYVLSSEGLYMDQAYATAVVLLVFVLVLNGISNLLAKQLTKGRNA